MSKIRLNIDGRELDGYKGQTILEIATENDIHIPAFCFDPRLEVYGACGICVVETEGSPKLLRACATEIADGMVVRTDTSRVRETRRVNLELLLSQHVGDCRAPCTLACPGQTDCQGYVGLIANGEMGEALKLIKTTIPLAASIGRVCPHPCEEACRRGLKDEPVSIMDLKRYAADLDMNSPEPYLPEKAPATGKSIGIIGGGPGGLSCAYYLAQMGHTVFVYEAMPKMGGMLRYGIPEYRLPKILVEQENRLIEKMGVNYRNNVRIGVDRSFESLRESHDAVVIAIGAWLSVPFTIPGGNLPGVYGGIDFLMKVFANEYLWIGKSVAVVGGGNTAMDACRTAIRLGAEKVHIIYRRTKAEMPADPIEIKEAEEEGVIFKYLVTPIEIIEENGRAVKMRLRKMKLGDMDESGRRRPVPTDEEETLEVDTVITALGQGINPNGFAGIELTRGNTIVADDHMFSTNEKGVFAIGDCINDGAAIAIKAIGNARKAAIAVDGYLTGVEIGYKEPYRVTREDMTAEDFADIKQEPRARVYHLATAERIDSFAEVAETLDKESAVNEAARCLECGCHDYFECKLISFADAHNVKPDRFRESVPNIKFEDNHPFILRDPHKCILCGLCVRICTEVVGASALGFVHRGYDTIVKPAFEDRLSETSCISCGQCVTVCPTGALQERTCIVKPIPLDTKKTYSVCGICAVGCSTRVESYGNLLIKTTPAWGLGMYRGMMCGRGRFAINYVQKEGRLTVPLLRRKGELTPVSWNEAFIYTAKKMESLRMRGEMTAVSIGHTYCVEDVGAISNLAKFVGSEIFSFHNRANGLTQVLGLGSSPNALYEVLGTKAIYVFGSSMLRNPVIMSRLRYAQRNGTPVTIVSIDNEEYNIPCKTIRVKNTTAFLKQVIKAVIEAGQAPKNADGYEVLKASLSSINVSGDARDFAKGYMSAKKAMILYSLGELSTTAAAAIANIAVLSGHIGSPRDGIYMLSQMSGSQILAEYKITKTSEVANGASGLMIFGEDPETLPEGLKFLMVQDTHLTKTALSADVVFPLAVYPEIDGTYVNTERQVRLCRKSIDPPMQYRTFEIAQKIAEVLEGSAPAGFTRELYPRVKRELSNEAPILYVDGFEFPDKKAKLQVIESTSMFDLLAPTSSLLKAVIADLPQPAAP